MAGALQALDSNNEKGKDADQYSDEYMRAVVHVLGLERPMTSIVARVARCGRCAIRLENLVVDDELNGIHASGGYYQLRTATGGVVDNLIIVGVDSFNHHKRCISHRPLQNAPLCDEQRLCGT
jgi:hypothetical protein